MINELLLIKLITANKNSFFAIKLQRSQLINIITNKRIKKLLSTKNLEKGF